MLTVIVGLKKLRSLYMETLIVSCLMVTNQINNGSPLGLLILSKLMHSLSWV